MRVYYDRDADLNFIKNKKVAIIGFGSQGHAHALNMRDSGVKDVVIAARPGASAKKAEAAGFKVMNVADAAKWADVMMMVTPDELQADIYKNDLARQHEAGRGAAVRARLQRPFPPDRAARRPGRADGGAQGPRPHRARRISQGRRRALPDRDAPGCQRQRPRSGPVPMPPPSAAAAPASSRPASARNAKPTCSANRSVLCGGLVELIRAGFETLVEAGYAPEMAYFECLHEVKLIVDLIYEGGIANMNYSISNTAEYGEYVTGPRIITAETKAEMKRVLDDIQTGKFARDWVLENKAGQASLQGHPRPRRGASDRGSRREPARHDAVDRQEQAGGRTRRTDIAVVQLAADRNRHNVMRIGTPLSPSAIKVMLLGSGELGKEVVIELQRLGVETIAVDRYADAPAQQVAHRAHVIDMTDAKALRALVERERPHLIVPEIEAIATDELLRIEKDELGHRDPDRARRAHHDEPRAHPPSRR